MHFSRTMYARMLLFIGMLVDGYSMIERPSHRIFDSNQMSDGDSTIDCLMTLDGQMDTSFFSFQRTPEDLFRETNYYCRRSSWPNDTFWDNSSIVTFEELRRTNITGLQLYDWNAPFDVIEDYLAGKEQGIFANCSDTLWFGAKCEYSLDDFEDVFEAIDHRFMEKIRYLQYHRLYTNGTCYEMLNDSQCGSILCLDWREICDGKIDCPNGIDEYRCEELEMNLCDPSSEHRCNDGQCVDIIETATVMKLECAEQFLEQNDHFIDCFFLTDEECENQKCPPLYFSCGDGHCYDGPSLDKPKCKTERDRRYLEQMPSSSSLILFSHIHLITDNNASPSICFDPTFCPLLSSKNHTHGNICFHVNQSSNDLVVDAKRLMRSCSLLPSNISQCSMYRCDDQSKCFSYHRLSDGYDDCSNGEDEHQPNVCSYNLPNRFSCDKEGQCLHDRLVYDGVKQCRDGTDEVFSKTAYISCENPFATNCALFANQGLFNTVTFDQICDGLKDFLPDNHNHSDESDCQMEEWPCETERSRCDQLWQCSDGRDELRCKAETLSSLYCNNNTHFCLDVETGEPKCLPLLKANDGNIDCLGSLDERNFCRIQHPYESHRRYRCRNSNQCIPIHYLCDCYQHCPENDDEIEACRWYRDQHDPRDSCGYFTDCFWERQDEYDGRSDLFCDLQDTRSNFFWQVHQIETASMKVISNLTNHQVKRKSNDAVDPTLIWTCNRGLFVHSRKDPSGFACFCPQYYYGDRCQYQRKRIKLILRLQMISSFHNRLSTYKFLVLLTHTEQRSSIIVDHHQFIYVPRFTCLPKVYVPLIYPLKEPYRYLTNYSIHVHVFDYQTLEHRAMWIFPLKFEFLPVQIIVKRLLVPEMNVGTDTKHIPFLYTPCQQTCSNHSRCIGHDVSLNRDICLCPIEFIGRRCLIPFNPCFNQNCSGHGICQPFNVFRDRRERFQCLCYAGWFGNLCKRAMAQISVSLDQNLGHLSRSMAFLHIVDPFSSELELPRYIYFDHLQKQKMNFTFILSDTNRVFDGAFIQFFEHQDQYDYYYLFIRHAAEKERDKIVSINLKSSHRCRSVNELFEKDMLSQPALLRVKSYQRPCRQYHQNPTFCFYDDHLMCICNEKDHHTYCFKFQTDLDRCDSKWCHGRGICVQDHHRCPVHSRCICEACAYGSFCQLTTAGYSLSLDSIIGSQISMLTSNLSEQPEVIRIAFGLVFVLVMCGGILNVLSIVTFLQPKAHEVSCGFYLLISSTVGLLTMFILLCKISLLIFHHQNNVSCALLDYLLKSCSISCEWLNASVAIERIVAMKRYAQYAHYSRGYYSKIITILIILFIISMSLPDILYRRIIVDPLDQRAWCVLTLNRDRWQILLVYSIWNLVSFILPLMVNLIGAIIIIIGTFQSKQKIFNYAQNNNSNGYQSWRTRMNKITHQIRQHKHLIITPIILALLSSPHVILTFIFVCTKLDENSIPSLIAYLVGYLPAMAIPIAFILPSSVYRQTLLVYLKTIFHR